MSVLSPFFGMIVFLLNTYLLAVLMSAIISWLVAFNVLPMTNSWVRSLYHFLTAITEPALRPIRRRLPSTGAFDFSPLVLVLAISLLIGLFGALRVA